MQEQGTFGTPGTKGEGLMPERQKANIKNREKYKKSKMKKQNKNKKANTKIQITNNKKIQQNTKYNLCKAEVKSSTPKRVGKSRLVDRFKEK